MVSASQLSILLQIILFRDIIMRLEWYDATAINTCLKSNIHCILSLFSISANGFHRNIPIGFFIQPGSQQLC